MSCSSNSGVESHANIARRPPFWELPLWREIHTSFFLSYPYQAISFVRRWAYDFVVLAPPLAAGIWWVSISKGTDLPADEVATANGNDTFLLSHHIARFYPTFIAFLLCVILLRANRTAKLRAAGLPGVSVAASLPTGIVVFLGALALIDLILVSGALLERAVPIVAAGVWIWLIRTQLYRRTRLLEPTSAGFRPPLRILLSRERRKIVQQHMLSARQRTLPADEVRSNRARAIAYFAATGDTAMHAWCVARAVDYNLGLGALAAAEELLDDAEVRYRDLAAEPCLHAAIGLFYLAVGSKDAAGAFRHAQSLCSAAGRRVPYRMRTLLAEADVEPTSSRATPQWSGWARVALAWNRRYATVIEDVLAKSLELSARDLDVAIGLAMFIAELADELCREQARSDLEPLEAINLAMIKGAARERLGDLLSGHEQFRESAGVYMDAAAIYKVLRYRARAGLASAYAATMSLRGGLAAEDAGMEMRVLAAALIGLQGLEYERGRLNIDVHRHQLLSSRETLHAHLFRALAENVHFNRRAAAELALWLAESVHRSALAERIREGHKASRLPGYDSGTGALKAREIEDWRHRPVEPVDIADVRQVITGRVVLYYRCAKTCDGWQIWVIMASSQDVTLHQANIANPPDGTSSMTHPAGLLHKLDSGLSEDIEFVHNYINLYSPAWSALAAALLPPGLGEALHQSSTPEMPATLLIVPDGPLSAVPFAGLRLPDGSMITDLAVVMFMPNLLWIAGSAVWPADAAADAATIVTHLGPTKFAATFRALLDADDYAGMRLVLLPTEDRASLEARLSDARPPDVVVISHHGETAADPSDRFIHLSGGGKLSERDAERLTWPRTVVLGSCWASDITVRAGQDAVGLPTACLLGGAAAVVGGQSVVRDNDVSARILGGVVLQAARGRHPALALRQAVLAHLAAHPADRRAPPCQWANLTVWTSQPPARGNIADPAWQSWTATVPATSDSYYAYVDFEKVFEPSAVSAPASTLAEPAVHYLTMPASDALRRALQLASSRGLHEAVTTLDLLSAIQDTDNADWTSFSVAAGFPAAMLTAARSREIGSDVPSADLLLNLDHRVRVTRAVANSFARGERLACHLGDPAITPAHVVYGFLAGGTNEAALWMCGQDNSADDLITLLGDRVFSQDLPANLTLKPVPGDLNKRGPKRSRSGVRHGPDPGSEFLATLDAAYQDGQRAFTTTLDFLGAMARAQNMAWHCLASAGFTLNVPDDEAQREREYGGSTVLLGMGYNALVSEKLAMALRTSAALAYQFGEREIAPAHVLYAMLCDQDSDAARWLRPPANSDGGPLAVLASEVFHRALPAPALLAEPPEPRGQDYGMLRPIVFLAGAWMLFKWGGAKVVKFVIGVGLLAIISVTMELADLNTAQPAAVAASANESALTGALTLSTNGGQTVFPATMIGELGTFYTQPAIHGLVNRIRQIFRPGTPSDLSGLYIFAVPSLAHRGHGPPSFSYRGGHYRARVICGGAISPIMCFAVVKLPPGIGPGGPSWQSEFLTGGRPGAIIRNEALVFTSAGASSAISMQRASIRVLGPATTRGLPQHQADVAVRSQADQAIRPLSPVMVNGRSRALPLLGLAIPPLSGRWYAVYPTAVIEAYADGIADRLAVPEPGETAFAGISVGNSSGNLTAPSPAILTWVQAGSPADYAGLQDGDQLTEIDGQRVRSPGDVTQLIEEYHPGESVQFVILRKGRAIAVTVTLGYRSV